MAAMATATLQNFMMNMTDGNRGGDIAITFPIGAWMKVAGPLHFGCYIV
jgi:hypothetical protein